MSTAWPSITSTGDEGDLSGRPGRSLWLGRTGYLEAARLQDALVRARHAGACPDLFLFLEHPPLVSLGRGSHEEHLLADAKTLARAGAEVWETSRGGDVTYHGPGQLVGYGILDLREHGRDVGRYLRALEEVLIRTLGDWGLAASRRAGLTGAWIGEEKVAAIGVRTERWITSHGFALNVDPDLSHFDWIVPCGIREHDVTSMVRRLGSRAPSLDEVAEAARGHLEEVFGRRFPSGTAAELERWRAGHESGSAAPLGGIRKRFPTQT